MQITHIVSTYPPYRGGMGNVVANYVSELSKNGNEMMVLTPEYRFHDPYPVDGIVFRVKPFFTFRNSAFVPKMYSFLKKAEIIHLHYPFFGGAEIVAWYKYKHPKKPLVITYHMDNVGSGVMGIFFRFYKKLIMPLILRQADQIIVSSNDYGQNSDLSPFYHKLKISELPFGVSGDYSSIAAKAPHTSFRLLFVASLDKAHYFKGLDNLIEALYLLVNEKKQQLSDISLELVIVGDGDMKNHYLQKVKNKGLTDFVRFRGRISNYELIKEYREADVTLLPSIDRSEAFGLVLIESMACGTPVIASDLPGVRSVVDDKENGLLVNPADIADLALAIQTLASDKDMHDLMKKNAQEKVEEKYRWPKIIEKLEKIYRDLL